MFRQKLGTIAFIFIAAFFPCFSLAAGSGLVIDDPYVRLNPPTAPATGAFMVIKNTTATDHKLVKAESPVANTVELHNHINENGVMKMREVPGIDVKSNGQAVLKPGSYHIMLIGVKQAMKEGELIPITLVFDDGSKKQISAPVRKLQTATPTAAPAKPVEHQGMKH